MPLQSTSEIRILREQASCCLLLSRPADLFFVGGEEVLAFVDELAGAFVNFGDDRVFENVGSWRRRRLPLTRAPEVAADWEQRSGRASQGLRA